METRQEKVQKIVDSAVEKIKSIVGIEEVKTTEAKTDVADGIIKISMKITFKEETG